VAQASTCVVERVERRTIVSNSAETPSAENPQAEACATNAPENFPHLIRSLPGTWLRDKDLVRSHHLPSQKDSGYMANSIAFDNHTFRAMDVNLRPSLCSEGKTPLALCGM
jgi:hypothetical protein